MLTKPYIFYHSHCQDGILATAIMMNHFKTLKTVVDPQVIPYNHGDPIDVKSLKLSRSFTKNKARVLIEVYFLDILPSVDIVRSVADTGCKVYIMDHHKSAIPIVKEIIEAKREIVVKTINSATGEYDSTGFITLSIPRYTNVENHFTLGLSGCGIAWKFVHGQTNSGPGFPNALVEFVQDRDLWNHNYKESNWILSYVSTYCRASSHEIYMEELEKWSRDTGHYTLLPGIKPETPCLLVNDHGMKCIAEGKRIFEKYNRECEQIAKNYVVRKLKLCDHYYNVAITECIGKYASAVGNMLAEVPGIDFAVTYEIVTARNGGGTQCRGIQLTLDNPENPYIYLRARGSTKNDLDISSIIRLWDAEGSTGGGHTKAAGSTSTMNKFVSSFCL